MNKSIAIRMIACFIAGMGLMAILGMGILMIGG